MRVLIDGVFFQLAQTGIARVWKSIIPRLALQDGYEFFVLNRGNMERVTGVEYINFPSYNATYAPDDSILVQDICDFFRIDVFMSTFYTTPLRTPAVQLVYDMIPERFDFDLKDKFWSEKEVAISFARSLICISNTTRRDLLYFYPELNDEDIAVAYLGYDRDVFKPRDEKSVRQFKRKYGIEKPFLLMVGTREQNKGYKNGRIVFDALAKSGEQELDLVCIGGEKEIDDEILRILCGRVNVSIIEASDFELSCAYSSAHAFVYPSLYEGFGLPIVEAMACGCPIITTDRGSLSEIALNNACLVIDPTSEDDLISAIELTNDRSQRQKMYDHGLLECEKYDWDHMVDAIINSCKFVHKMHVNEEYSEFFEKWSQLRKIQSEVNTSIIT